MNRHLSDDDLLNRLYGAVEDQAHAAHLDECDACTGRLAGFEQRREEAAATPEVSSEFLAAQRRMIYARLERRPSIALRWAPALVAGFLVAVGVFLYHSPYQIREAAPYTGTPVAHIEQNDEQLFWDLYSIQESAEPRAAAPIRALFDMPAVEGEQ